MNTKTIGNLGENTGILVVEMFAPPVLDDVIEHEIHSLKKAFVTNFKNEDSLKDKFTDFFHEIKHDLTKDSHLIKHIFCFHPKHSSMMKSFLERSLLNNGFETLVGAGVIAVVGAETIPAVIAGVVISQIGENFEQKSEPKIVNSIHSLRDKFLSSKKSTLNI